MTLESQYKSYQSRNPTSTYTFDEWKEKVLKPFVEDAARQISEIEKKR